MLILGMAYLYCNASGSWADKTDYEECTLFLVSDVRSKLHTRTHVFADYTSVFDMT